MASVSGSSTGLPTSLHSVYQRYKAGTAVSTDWLVKTGAPQLTTTTDRLPVQRFLELAQAAAKRKISPPKTLRTTFKIVLAHRRTLTRYHQDHHAGSETVKKSTDSREFFNEILAQAYDTLFPAGADAFTKKSPRHIDAQQMDIASESSNRFVTLSEMIEHEPDSDPAYVAPSVETAKPDARSQIEDDPLEEIIAMYTYILEVECAINLVNKTWIMARNGQLPLTVAGTLTNSRTGRSDSCRARMAQASECIRDYASSITVSSIWYRRAPKSRIRSCGMKIFVLEKHVYSEISPRTPTLIGLRCPSTAS
jgi:hypothetical protein